MSQPKLKWERLTRDSKAWGARMGETRSTSWSLFVYPDRVCTPMHTFSRRGAPHLYDLVDAMVFTETKAWEWLHSMCGHLIDAQPRPEVPK